MAWVGEFIDELSAFDREMNKVVNDSGILAGIPEGRLTEIGKQAKPLPLLIPALITVF